MKKSILSLMLCSLTGVVAACGTSAESEIQGWGLRAVAHKSTTINVCWENRSKSDLLLKRYRFEFENHDRSKFGQTKLSLVGWSDCTRPSGKDEIRLTWWDPGEAKLEDKGRSNIGVPIGISGYTTDLHRLPQIVDSSFRAAPTLALNGHSFSDYSQKIGLNFAKAYFKNVILHELGHAVGMLHEHARPDNHNLCPIENEVFYHHQQLWNQVDSQSIAKSAVGTSRFDFRSIMNYCYLLENDGKVVGLSNGDIGTINALYSPSESNPSSQPKPSAPAPVYAPAPAPVYTPAPAPAPVYAPAPAPVYAPAPAPVYAPAPAPVASSCNRTKLNECLAYDGGNACYPKWGCPAPTPLF